MPSQNPSQPLHEETFFLPQCELCVIHSSLQPDEISKILDLASTSSVRIGESTGGVIARRSIWVLHSLDSIGTQNLEDHLDWLVSKLSSKRSTVKTLKKTGALIELHILIDTWNRFEQIKIPAKIITTLGQLGIGIDVHVVIHEDRREFYDYVD
ncbi:MAG: DUF4279 domain-containing protein [Candidatus Melainabacteria bacterium]|nr:DUF4279 domain-containing protein [Candidatus Melainabacteria bacterium]